MTPQDVETIYRLLMAAGLGAAIGLERELSMKEAGFKTYTLVCIGSALMMIVSINIFETYRGITVVDPARIAAQVVTGIGF
ncbi:MAG TPA: MgtC/SapB family protein, partial [Candidatus Omnitrophota bacterium]|nr:MgtC/SapB family protein [Candidatus Omnitrophota bacterium]